MENNNIILFDGACNLCNAWVQFVIKHDVCNKFKFASLQSQRAKDILKQRGIIVQTDRYDTFYLITHKKLKKKSSAALTVLSHLEFPFFLFKFLFVIPLPIRDALYTLVAKNRYRLFGKSESCLRPSPEITNKFL